MTKKMEKSILAILCCFIMLSCQKKEQVAENANYRIEGETVVIPETSNIKSKLKVGKVIREPYLLQIFSPAKISAIPTKYAEIAAPFNGRLVKSFIKLGQHVTTGTPLFSIYSSDYTDAQKLYLQAFRQFQLAEKDLKRQKDLLDNGVGIQKEFEAAKTNYDVLSTEYEKTKTSIRVFGVDPETMIFGEPLIVHSPIQGQIIKNKVVVGKYLTDNSEAILTIAELSSVWITATVKEKDIRFVHENDSVKATVLAYPDEIFEGMVYHIEEIVDENTRAINVFTEFKNPNMKLKPGMYASVKIIDKPVLSNFVPSTALLQQNDKSFVFLELASGKYRKQVVKTGEAVSDKVLVTEGLTGDESIVVQGGFYLLTAK